MIFKIRFLDPYESSFMTAKGVDFADAACALLLDNTGKALFIKPDDAGRVDGCTTYFAKMKVTDISPEELGEYKTDDGVFVARCFMGGIGRKGGIKSPRNPLQCNSLREVEKRLGLSEGYLDCDWAGEESEEDAILRARKS